MATRKKRKASSSGSSTKSARGRTKSARASNNSGGSVRKSAAAASKSSGASRKSAITSGKRGRPRKAASSPGQSGRSSQMPMRGQDRENRLSRGNAPDAISLLREDHREVEAMFAQFESSNASARKRDIVQKLCDALTVHATIEEEIFYPKARETLKRAGENLMDEAEVEHEGIKWRVQMIEKMKPDEDLFDAEVKVLREYVEHHVREEERKIFPKLRLSRFDNQRIGQLLAARKEEMTGEPVREEPTLLERGLRALTGSQENRPSPE
jgi:hemerythrin superfamily protein